MLSLYSFLFAAREPGVYGVGRISELYCPLPGRGPCEGSVNELLIEELVMLRRVFARRLAQQLDGRKLRR